jgi:sporulation protein YlmC with PRC-barrel domain
VDFDSKRPNSLGISFVVVLISFLIKKGGIMSLYEKTYETDNRTGTNQEGPDANRPVQRLTATSIIGDKIENAEGDDLGTIDNLMINLHTGRIEYVVLEYGSFLGLGGKLFAIPFSELRLAPGRHAFILDRPPCIYS